MRTVFINISKKPRKPNWEKIMWSSSIQLEVKKCEMNLLFCDQWKQRLSVRSSTVSQHVSCNWGEFSQSTVHRGFDRIKDRRVYFTFNYRQIYWLSWYYYYLFCTVELAHTCTTTLFYQLWTFGGCVNHFHFTSAWLITAQTLFIEQSHF